MAAKKPAKGKAPAVKFSNAPAEKKTRGPRTGTKNQPLVAPIMDNEDNADNLRKALSESQSRQSSLPEGWKPLGTTQESATEKIESKPANINFTPTDLARKYSFASKISNTGSINPEMAERRARVAAYQKQMDTKYPPEQRVTIGGTTLLRASTPQSEWASARANYESMKAREESQREEYRKEEQVRNNQTPVSKESSTSSPASRPFNLAAQQENWRQVVRPRLGRDRALPHRNALDIKSDGTVTVTPVKSAPGAPELAYTDKTKSFAPNESNITADEYRPVPGGLGHMVDGEHISAYTKHTSQYVRSNNNGVAGLLKTGETQHPGTFYTHPETQEVIKTNAKPVEKQYSALEVHHSALYAKYGQKDARRITGSSAAPSRYSISGTTDSYNWARKTLPEAINSSRGGDVQGTMAELKSDPNSIHKLFEDHFVIGPQKERAYQKAVKDGIVAYIPKPSELLRKKAKLVSEANKPYLL